MSYYYYCLPKSITVPGGKITILEGLDMRTLSDFAAIWTREETPEETPQSSSSRTQPTPQPLSLWLAQATEARF